MTLSQIKNIVGHTPWPPPKGYYDYRRPGSLYEHMFKRTLLSCQSSVMVSG